MYYQNRYRNDLRGEFWDPITFRDMTNVTPDIIINGMKKICEENGIPAHFRKERVEVTEGRSHKEYFDAIEISHPNPPRSYFKQLFVILPGGMQFFVVGESVGFAEWDRYSANIGLKNKARSFFGLKPDEKLCKQEMEWHETIYSVFHTLLE